MATQAINAAYKFIGLSQPDILFFSTPYAALKHIYHEVQNSCGKIEDTSLSNPIAGSLIEVSSRFTNVLVPEVIADYGYYIGYCHEVLDCDLHPTKWDIFYDLITNCGWIFPYEKVAIICDQH